MKKIQKFSYLIILALALSVCASNAHAFGFPLFCKTFLADAIRMKSLKTQNDAEQDQEQNNEQDAKKAANFGNRYGTEPLYNFMDNMDWDRFGDNPTAALSDAAGKTGKGVMGNAQKDLKEYAAKKQEERRAKKEAQKAKEEEQMTEEEKLKKQQEEENKKKNKKFKESVYKWYKENGSAQSAVNSAGSQAASGDFLGGLETGGKGLVDAFVDSQKDW